MNDYRFGNFLCMLREKNGMTQADVASKLGVTPAAVSKWENGSSKPRVEVLFQLAQLLGVRAEELMCGQYIPVETLDPAVVKQINERYTYLMRVDAYDSNGVKWRRILAWVIDWNLIGFLVILLAAIVLSVLKSAFQNDYQAAALILTGTIFLFPIGFVLRDLLFGGRSPGKRIMDLAILDRQTGMPAKAGKCALRNLFLVVVHIDAVFLLVSGATLGDRAANTLIVRKKTLSSSDRIHEITEINQYSAPKKANTKKTVLIIAMAVAIAIVLLISVVLISLSAAKRTEEYKVAYAYFVESQAFDELDVDESEIWSNAYSLTTYLKPSSDQVTQTAKIGFIVNGKSFQVICHKQNDVWSVCSECTEFQ